MKVFICSTCYDLVDLRAEVKEDLRDLDVEVLLSDHKDSDFVVPSAPDTNSIEACLANLRRSDVIVVILSQRYGPKLGAAFGDVSATHVEYSEARKLNKPIYFYVRDRLDADFGAWRRNGSKADFVGAWCGKEGVNGLFAMIDAHRQLVGPDGTSSKNNWYSTFISSPDLRADIRRRLAPRAYRDTGEKMVRQGEVPILMVIGNGTSAGASGGVAFQRLSFNLLNVGTQAAIGVQGDLLYGGIVIGGGNDSRVGAVQPNSPNSATISFDLKPDQLTRIFGEETGRASDPRLLHLQLGYTLPSGHVMRDHFDIEMIRVMGAIQLTRLPDYGGKTIVGMRNHLRSG
jgi:hypothetical protein